MATLIVHSYILRTQFAWNQCLQVSTQLKTSEYNREHETVIYLQPRGNSVSQPEVQKRKK